MLNPSSPKGGLQHPPNSFRPGAKNEEQKGKIAPGIFKFILSLHFIEKKIEPTTKGNKLSKFGGQGVGAIP